MRIIPAVANKYDSELNTQHITEMLLKGWKVSKIGFLFNTLQETEPMECSVQCVPKNESSLHNQGMNDEAPLFTIDADKFVYEIFSKRKRKSILQSENVDYEPFIGYKTYLFLNVLIILALVFNIPNVLLYLSTIEWFPTNILFWVLTLLIIIDTMDLLFRIGRRKRVNLNKWRVAWYRITRMVIPPLTIISLIINAVLFMG